MGSQKITPSTTDAQVSDDLGVPGWHLWYSDARRPWATRFGTALTPEQEAAGCEMTLDADDLPGLRAKIRAQPDFEAPSQVKDA